jgi:acyl-CoA thioester hydrolase
MTNAKGQTPKGLGHFDGKVHVLPLRIYYEDTDLSGLVYHANYLRFMERGRTEFFRLAGVTRMADLESAEPTAWAIRNAELSFLRPARVDDQLNVHSVLTSISGARLFAIQRIFADGNLLVEGRIEACIVTLTGRPRRIPQPVRDLLSPFLDEDAV